MTDRDAFASAALTGLLASDQYDRLVTAADYAETAYEIADAMLRERAKTNHDAAPEATANAESDEAVAENATTTLTDAEREALHWFSHYGLPEPKAAALRGLLERLSRTQEKSIREECHK